MRITDFKAAKTGELVRTESRNWAFLPDALPPLIKPSMRLLKLTSEAEAELGRLCGLAEQLSDPGTLFMNFMRREAVLSSRIEGTHSTIGRVALIEKAGTRAGSRDDREVSNYVEALELGMKRCHEIPLGTTFVCEIHARLMHQVARRNVTPGKFRTRPVLVGGDGTFPAARYVPPPAYELSRLMDDLELFLRDDTLPVLIRTAIAHYQFEAIHPFDDGNGRVGRILISTMLGSARRLNVPMLYLSAYFERYKLQYYDRLLAISQAGAWDDWFEFFLVGVKEQARDASIRANRLHQLREQYRNKLSTPRTSATMHKLIDALFEIPVTSVTWASEAMGVGFKPAKESLKKLVAQGVLSPADRFGNMQIYTAAEIQRILDLPTEEITEEAIP